MKLSVVVNLVVWMNNVYGGRPHGQPYGTVTSNDQGKSDRLLPNDEKKSNDKVPPIDRGTSRDGISPGIAPPHGAKPNYGGSFGASSTDRRKSSNGLPPRYQAMTAEGQEISPIANTEDTSGKPGKIHVVQHRKKSSGSSSSSGNSGSSGSGSGNTKGGTGTTPTVPTKPFRCDQFSRNALCHPNRYTPSKSPATGLQPSAGLLLAVLLLYPIKAWLSHQEPIIEHSGKEIERFDKETSQKIVSAFTAIGEDGISFEDLTNFLMKLDKNNEELRNALSNQYNPAGVCLFILTSMIIDPSNVEEIKGLFKLIDKDHDGRITAHDLSNFMLGILHDKVVQEDVKKTISEKMNKMMKKITNEPEGELSLKEFIRLVKGGGKCKRKAPEESLNEVSEIRKDAIEHATGENQQPPKRRRLTTQ